MSQKKAMCLSIMLVAIVMGIMVAVQFRAVNQIYTGPASDRSKEIAADLKRINMERDNLAKEINDLEEKLQQLKKGQNEAVEALTSELEKARLSAGLLTVQGPGVEVVLDNPEVKGSPVPSDLGAIQDYDLLSLVNELWGAGAEAVSINGQRITANSEIRLAASFVNINTTRVVPPYQVLAIGPADELAENLLLPSGLVEYFQDMMGFLVTVEKHEMLTIPAYDKK